MIRFDKIVETFARKYKSMLHNPDNGNRRFFRMNSVSSIDEMIQNVGNLKSPIVSVEVYLEGSIGNKDNTAEWTVFFFCNGGDAGNIDLATDCKVEAHEHLLRFIATMRRWKREKKIGDINLGDGQMRLRYYTVGPVLNNWYGVGTTFLVPEGLNRCEGDDYMDETIPDLESE